MAVRTNIGVPNNKRNTEVIDMTERKKNPSQTLVWLVSFTGGNISH